MNIIEYIITEKKIKQVELAKKIGVSSAQVSKWKKGEAIPYDRQIELNKIADLFGNDFEWALLVGTEANSHAWIDYFKYINNSSWLDCFAPSIELSDEPEVYAPSILNALNKLGLKIPATPSSVEQLKEEEYEFTTFDNFIINYISSYSPLAHWCHKNIEAENIEIYDDYIFEMLYYSIFLALASIENNELKANFSDFDKLSIELSKIENEVRNLLHTMCARMKESDIEIKTDYFDFVNLGTFQISDGFLFDSALKDDKVNVESYFSYEAKVILEEVRANRMLLEQIAKSLNIPT